MKREQKLKDKFDNAIETIKTITELRVMNKEIEVRKEYKEEVEKLKRKAEKLEKKVLKKLGAS